MKMHGLGNDFVVVDGRVEPQVLSPAAIAAIADRHRGVGFDQLALIRQASDADAELLFWNSDGSTSATCGNATRCIARYLMETLDRTKISLKTERGVLDCVDADGGLTSVNMGHPQTDWQEVPLAREMDTLTLPLDGAPTATGMGNPHCTFFVEDAEAVDLPIEGARFETDPLFPERTNVQFASLLGPNKLRMRVWERGVGVTLASGSSSCATAVAAARKGLTGRKVEIVLDGGTLFLDWREDGVWMTGPTEHVFDGKWWL